MFTQKFIKIFHSVQKIASGLFSLFQNLNLGNASANPKWHLTIPWATSCLYQCVCKILLKYSKRFKSYRHFSRTGRWQNLHKQAGDKIKYQNLNLGNASANPKWDLTISWATSCQYQSVCKILSKYSKRFKSYRHFSRIGRWQNFHKQAGDKIKCLIIGHTMKLSVSVDFLMVLQFEPRQRLGQSQMTFDNLLGYILSISMCMQNFIKIFQTV